MKKVLYILNDCMRLFTYERTAGFYRALERLAEPVDLYIIRSDGYSDFSPEHNCGEYNIFRLPSYDRFDGIILDINNNFTEDSNAYASEGIRYAIRTAAKSGKPVISIANELEDFFYVGIDNYSAMQSVIRHLHETQGLSDFWFAMGPPDNFENLERGRGLQEYCLQHGLPCGADRFYSESFVESCGHHAFKKLLEQHGGVLPQAVICANDHIALGICRAAQKAGYQIPKDLMVTGFDNADVSLLSPSITTVNQPRWSTGEVCADVLQRIWSGEALPAKIFTPTELILRESTGQKALQGEAKKQIREYIQLSSRASDYSYRLSALQYQLPGCKSIEEIGRALIQCLSKLECKGVSVVLDSALLDGGGMIHLDDQPGKTHVTAEDFPIEGYSERMEVVFSWDEKCGIQCTKKKLGHSLYLSEDAHTRNNYLVAPLHFMAHAVGYLVIRDCINLIRIKGASSIVNTLTMALRSYFDEKNLAYMNQLLSGISRKDELTGLYNRLGYHDLAYPMFRSLCSCGGHLGILFMDMDGLKIINDTLGHAMGDLAIRSVSNAILGSLPAGALPVRFGGDEFLVLLPDAAEAHILEVISNVHSLLPVEANKLGAPDFLDVSAGYIISELGDQKTLDEYVREADELMYKEKKAKKKQRV